MSTGTQRVTADTLYVRCNKCHGTGRLRSDDPERSCEVTIQVGHETVGCFASRQHPGAPHMAIVCEPCVCCGQYDECHDSCVLYPAEPPPKDTSAWFWWESGDLALHRDADGKGQAWRNEYQPDSPWARKRTAGQPASEIADVLVATGS